MIGLFDGCQIDDVAISNSQLTLNYQAAMRTLSVVGRVHAGGRRYRQGRALLAGWLRTYHLGQPLPSGRHAKSIKQPSHLFLCIAVTLIRRERALE